MDFSDFTHTPGPDNPSFLQLTGSQPNYQFARDRLTSVSVSSVPETGATLPLLALAGGLLGLGLRRLRMN